MLSPAYRLLLARLQELLPGWRISADADTIWMRDSAKNELNYSSTGLLIFRYHGFQFAGPASPDRVIAIATNYPRFARAVFGEEEMSDEDFAALERAVLGWLEP